MSQIHHISHIDLDGYACTYLVDLHLPLESDNLTQSNVDYDELTQHLTQVLSSVNPEEPLDHLLITDLNLKPKDVSVVLSYKNRFRHLTLLDHHNNDATQMQRLQNAVDCTLVLDRDRSATQHTYDWLVASHGMNPEHERAFTELVNTYDMFLVENHHLFPLAYTVNNWFFDAIRPLKGLVHAAGVRRLAVLYMEYISYVSDHIDETIRPIDIDEVLSRILDEAFLGKLLFQGLITSDTQRILYDLLDQVPYVQALDLVHAAMLVGPEGIAEQYIQTYHGVTILMSPERLPRGMLHHLMYTLETVDIHLMRTDADKGRIEFRQHKLKPHVDLSVIAGHYGGGGHVGAAGCHCTTEWPMLQAQILSQIKEQLRDR